MLLHELKLKLSNTSVNQNYKFFRNEVIYFIAVLKFKKIYNQYENVKI